MNTSNIDIQPGDFLEGTITNDGEIDMLAHRDYTYIVTNVSDYTIFMKLKECRNGLYKEYINKDYTIDDLQQFLKYKHIKTGSGYGITTFGKLINEIYTDIKKLQE